MIDLHAMQQDYEQRLIALQISYGINYIAPNGTPVGISADAAVNYAKDAEALYGEEYERRLDAVYMEKAQQLYGDTFITKAGGDPRNVLDKDIQLILADQVKSSFGGESNFAATLPKIPSLLKTWGQEILNTIGLGDSGHAPKTAADIIPHAVGADPTVAVAKPTADALSFMLAAAIIYWVVK